jgi:hypothetical protein
MEIEREDRRWVPALASESATEAECDQYLSRQLEFDPDIWVVVVEDRRGRHFLDDWLASAR